MKKDKLIELLNSIEGNPEIVLWNGYAADYMHIDPNVEKLTLVKETKEFTLDMLKSQYCSVNRTFEIPEEELEQMVLRADELHKTRKWEQPNNYVEPENFKYWYGNKKKVLYVLNAKLRGKTSLGMCRAGDIEY